MKKLHLALAIALFSIAAMPVRASFVIPASNANAEAGSNVTQRGLFGDGDITELYQIAGSELAAQGISIGDSITGVRARINGGLATGPAADMNWASMTIRFAQATNPISGLSETFADNMANPQTVFSGPYTLEAGSMPGGSIPNAFGALLSFTSPYTYQGGDLVFFFTHSAATGGSLTQDFRPLAAGIDTLYGSVLGAVGNTVVGQLSGGMAILKFETAAVPEPSAWPLLLTGAAMVQGMKGARRRS